MKNTFLVSISLLCLAVSCGQKQEQKQETVDQETTTLYGEKFEQMEVKSATNLNTLMASSDSIPLVLSGEIEKTCVKKGSWMEIKTNDEKTIRVTFKDYGFFVPKEGMEGKRTVMNGYCIRKETSVDELKHFAQDAGESEDFIATIVEPKTEYSFVASGVLIQN